MEEEDGQGRRRVHMFEYVGRHAEAGDIAGTVRRFWYHMVGLEGDVEGGGGIVDGCCYSGVRFFLKSKGMV